MVAAKAGRSNSRAVSLRHGADVDARNDNGGTALMFAAIPAHVATIALLIDHGADVNAVGQFNWTALMVAASKGHGDAVRLLLRHGADPNVQDTYGAMPLMRGRVREQARRVDSHCWRTSGSIWGTRRTWRNRAASSRWNAAVRRSTPRHACARRRSALDRRRRARVLFHKASVQGIRRHCLNAAVRARKIERRAPTTTSRADGQDKAEDLQ